MLKDYAPYHLSLQTHRGQQLRPTTLQGYEGLLRRNILAPLKNPDPNSKRPIINLGALRLRQITTEVVEEWYAAVIAATPPGSTQAAKSYRLLKTMLNRAVRTDEISFNPCKKKGAGYERAEEPSDT